MEDTLGLEKTWPIKESISLKMVHRSRRPLNRTSNKFVHCPDRDLVASVSGRGAHQLTVTRQPRVSFRTRIQNQNAIPYGMMEHRTYQSATSYRYVAGD